MAAWERSQELQPVDWHAIGLKEITEDDPEYPHMRAVAKAAKRYRQLTPLADLAQLVRAQAKAARRLPTKKTAGKKR